MTRLALLTTTFCLLSSPVLAAGYDVIPLVANKAHYKPQLPVEPGLVNAWGIAIRPAGAGGIFGSMRGMRAMNMSATWLTRRTKR